MLSCQVVHEGSPVLSCQVLHEGSVRWLAVKGLEQEYLVLVTTLELQLGLCAQYRLLISSCPASTPSVVVS